MGVDIAGYYSAIVRHPDGTVEHETGAVIEA